MIGDITVVIFRTIKVGFTSDNRIKSIIPLSANNVEASIVGDNLELIQGPDPELIARAKELGWVGEDGFLSDKLSGKS